MSNHRKPCGCVIKYGLVDGVVKFLGYVVKCYVHKGEEMAKKKKKRKYTKKSIKLLYTKKSIK